MITGLLEHIISGYAWTDSIYLTDENNVALDADLLNESTISVSIMDEDCCRCHLTTADVTVLGAGTIQWNFPSIGLCQDRYILAIDVTGEDGIPVPLARLTLPITRN